MKDWRNYWEDRAKKYDPTDFCLQVGRSVEGKPVPKEELKLVIDQTIERLDLRPSDRLLDLCCGNGLLTRWLADFCGLVVGVDYSPRMIRIAEIYHAGANVRYVEAPVTILHPEMFPAQDAFNKVVILESLHYLHPHEVPLLLNGVRSVGTPDVLLYFSGVPDRQRIWSYYDTPERREEHFASADGNGDLMGYWWTEEELRDLAQGCGYRCLFLQQNPQLNTAHYRFDVKLMAV
jgi:cyclopropane fatty-acyl-phospholipid synthase-like methyltransferase